MLELRHGAPLPGSYVLEQRLSWLHRAPERRNPLRVRAQSASTGDQSSGAMNGSTDPQRVAHGRPLRPGSHPQLTGETSASYLPSTSSRFSGWRRRASSQPGSRGFVGKRESVNANLPLHAGGENLSRSDGGLLERLMFARQSAPQQAATWARGTR